MARKSTVFLVHLAANTASLELVLPFTVLLMLNSPTGCFGLFGGLLVVTK